MLTACGTADTATSVLRYLGKTGVPPPAATLDGTMIGGLSGISYDANRQLYYIISDYHSDKTPRAATPREYHCRTRASTTSSSWPPSYG